MTSTLHYGRAVRVEDRLQGAQNFPTCNERITRILGVSDAEEHIDSMKVAPIDPADLESWKKIDSRAMLIIMDGVKDHIVPHLSRKKSAEKDVDGFGEFVPKQERELKDGAVREDAQYQHGQGRRSCVVSHKSHTAQRRAWSRWL